LPQDIIFILKDNNIIKNKYLENKEIYNFKDYIGKCKNIYKISIIYTYTDITNIIEGFDTDMSFIISEINSEDALKNSINAIKNENYKLKKIIKYVFILIYLIQKQ